MRDVADLILEMCDVDPRDSARLDALYRLVLKATALERVYECMAPEAAAAARWQDAAAGQTYACFGLGEEQVYDTLLARHGIVST